MTTDNPEGPKPEPDATPEAAVTPEAPVVRDYGPQMTFEVLGAAHEPFAAQPTLRFEMGVSEPSEREIYAISVTAQINFDPARREYDAETRAALFEIFGAPERWPSTTRSFLWTHSTAMVHSFQGAITFGLEVPCTADLEVVASRYVSSLPDGDVPLTFHFTGRIFYQGPNRQVQVVHIPWDTSCQYRMPVATWKAMISHHHGESGFALLHNDTMQSLMDYKRARGLHSFDACVADLLERAPVDPEEVAG